MMERLFLTMILCLGVLHSTGASAGNLLRNGSFEAGQAHWFLHGTLTVGEKMSICNDGARDGARCVLVEKPDHAGGEAQLASDYVVIEPGQDVTLSAWLRSDRDDQQVTLRVWSWDAASHGKRHSGEEIVSVGRRANTSSRSKSTRNARSIPGIASGLTR